MHLVSLDAGYSAVIVVSDGDVVESPRDVEQIKLLARAKTFPYTLLIKPTQPINSTTKRILTISIPPGELRNPEVIEAQRLLQEKFANGSLTGRVSVQFVEVDF